MKLYTVNNGLPQHDVSSIIEDNYGYIWMATYDGLVRYDGYEFTKYRYDPKKDNSIRDNRIICLLKDSFKNLWIGTEGGGLHMYNYETDSFISIKMSNNLMDQNIHSLFEDPQNRIWIGTVGGLFTLDPKTNKVTQILSANNSIGTIHKIHVTFDSKIFIGSSNGLSQINIEQNKAIRFNQIETQSIYAIKEISNYSMLIGGTKGLFQLDYIDNKIKKIGFEATDIKKIRSITKQNENIYLIGTENQGIFELNTSGKLDISPVQIENSHILKNAWIKDLYIDSFRNLWIGTGNIGVARINLSAPKFLRSFDDPISNNFIKTFLKDSKGRVWVQCKTEPIFALKDKVKHTATNGEKLTVNSLIEDKNGNIWASTSDNIYILSSTENEANLLNESNKLIMPDQIRNNLSTIRDIKADRFGNIWIGSKNALIVIKNYGQKDMSFKVHNEFQIKHKNINITRLLPEMKSNKLWICSYDMGVIVAEINKEGEIVVQSRFYNSENSNNKLKSNHVWAITQSSNGEIWVGTDAGLNRIVFEKENYIVKPINKSAGLQNEKIISIVEDNYNSLWLATSEGLISFNPHSNETFRYNYIDGLSSNSFAEAGIIDEKGTIHFATINGITSFDPKQIRPNAHAPKTMFSDLQIFNKIIRINEKNDKHILLDKSINEVKQIRLNHKENNFTIKFTGIHFQKPDKNQFAYKLDGYDNNWIYQTANNRAASYNNLKPGKYKLSIKTANSDNIWSDIKTIDIVILAAPWATWWAYSIYIILFIITTWYIYMYKKRQEKLKHQLEIEYVHHTHQRNLQEARLKFHSNLTHEIRTPLSLISAPLTELLNSCIDNEDTMSRLGLIKRSSDRLLTLVNQFLDIHKIDKACMPLNISKCDLNKFAKSIYNSFNPLFMQKNISFTLKECYDSSECWIDKDKVSKTIHNLLSNAAKFTPKNGSVSISVQLAKGILTISISDNGPGIKESEMNAIFERFYQSESNRGQGTGIGLSLVKELITLHKGSIFVENNTDRGCCFTVNLPTSKDMYSSNEFLTMPDNTIESINEINEDTEPKYEDKHIVLIIEDDIDMRKYLISILKEQFEVFAADNAEEGLAIAIDRIPNIIVTDISLPDMDGIELCSQLKANDNTSHIPIIMLTAKVEDTDIKKGYEAGAEMYLTKPFNPDLLKVQIKNIVSYRTYNKLESETEQAISSTPKIESESHLNEREQAFIFKLNKILDDKMEDTDFSIEDLCKEIGTSRMQLHRKLTAVLGQSTSEYIRNYKMKKAISLLESGNYNVSEVIYQVGFKSHSHFTKVFKEAFNISPSEYIKKNL